MWQKGEITVNHRPEQVKVIMIRETSSWKPVPLRRGSWQEAARVDLTSHPWNTEGMRAFRYDARSMAGRIRER